jgi:acyl dehydratase
MAVDTSLIGKPTGTSKCANERGPISAFARVVGNENAIYFDPTAAQAAGFRDIPAAPTWAFSAMDFWGKYPEIQPPAADDSGDPTKGQNVIMQAIGSLMAKGGLILHGEQEFEYHRPVVVGDVLSSEGRVADLYQKESGGRTMTFLVTETVWKDDTNGEPVLTARMNLIHRS